MMQVGIFSGYFPYSLEETAKKSVRSILMQSSWTCISRISI